MRRVVMRVEQFETNELRHRIPLRARPDFVEAVVGIAAVAETGAESSEVADDPSKRAGAYRSSHQAGLVSAP